MQIILIALAAFVMFRVAKAKHRSPSFWSGLTIALGLLAGYSGIGLLSGVVALADACILMYFVKVVPRKN